MLATLAGLAADSEVALQMLQGGWIAAHYAHRPPSERARRGTRTPSLPIWRQMPSPAPLELRTEGWAFE